MRLGWLVLVAALAAGCSKCGGGATAAKAGPERVLPRGAVGVVLVPSLGDAGKKLQLLERLKVADFAAQLQGFADGKGLGDALVAELGVDPRSPEALEQAGVDGSRGAAVGVLATGHGYLALPVKDPARLHHALESLASRRLGAGANGEQRFGELVVKTFSPQQGTPPRLGYVLAHGFALVTDGAGVSQLAGLAAMTESDSLAADRAFEAHVGRLPKARDVVVYLPTGSPALLHAPVTAIAAAVSLTAAGLEVTVDAPWKGDGAQLAVLQPKTTAHLTGYLPADAFLVAEFSGEPALLAPWAKTLLGPYLSRALEAGGLDVKGAVLEQLQPGAVVALSLADRPPLGDGMPSLDLRQTNPFSYAHLSGAARVKNPAVVLPALEKVVELAPRFGAEMRLAERPDGQKAVLTTWAAGEGVHFAPKGDFVFFGSPVQRLDALVKSDGKGTLAPPGADAAVAVAVDLARLATSVRELPESAWGLGGFAIKGTTLRWLDATNDLKAITLSVGAKGTSVQARLLLSLAPPQPAR